MKRKLQIALLAIISLLQFQPINAQLTPKDLGTPVYNGQGNPTSSKFVQLNTIKDSVTYTQLSEGMNVVTKAAPWIPVTWYATSDSGFVANGAYTVEAKVAVTKSMKNGFFLEMEGTPGKRFKIDIDTAAIYNMTYSPSTPKEVLVNNLDNKGMHTYRVAVDNTDKVHIYRDGEKVGTADADGLVSSSAYFKDLETIMEDQFFEDYTDLFAPAHIWPATPKTTPKTPTVRSTEEATLLNNLLNWDISYSDWCHMGIDTVKANVKVGNSSVWFNNGTTGELKIKKTDLTPGKYKLSFWSKTLTGSYKGYVYMIGTDPNRPAVKYKDGRPDSIPAYTGTDPHVTVLPSAVLVPNNRNFNYREYAFDVTKDCDIMIVFHNGWSPGEWSNMWFDDLRIAKVEAVPFIRFGKDSEAGVTDFTLGSLTYDMTGAYEPAPTSIKETKNVLNSIYTTNTNGMLQVNYTLVTSSKTTIQLLDLSGRILYQQNTVSNIGKNLSSIPTSNMKGVYLLRLITAEQAKTVKVELK